MTPSAFAERAVPARPQRGASLDLRWPKLAWTVLPFLAPAGVLLLWELVTELGVVSRQVLVPPGQVSAAFRSLLASGELERHLKKSLLRLALGFGIGASAGLGLGIAMAASKRVEELVSPTFRAARQIPSIALIPALIVVLGVDEMFKIVVVAKATFFPMTLAAFDGVRNTSRRFLDVALVNRVPRSVLLSKLLVPSALPHVVAGIRTSLGRSWMILVASELIAADAGIGQMMEMGRQMFRIDVVMVGVFLTGGIGLALDTAVRLAERRLVPWKRR